MPIDKKTIKSYDAYALKWAQKMRAGDNTVHTYLEKPAMHKKLPSLKGKTVLCMGCGTGEECEHLKSLGAKKVIGIDISRGLIDVAQKSYPNIEFHVMDMEKMHFRPASFDFVYSSLTMHYIKDWSKTLHNVHTVLKRNGSFLFSTYHPIKSGIKTTRTKKKYSFIIGFEKSKSSQGKIFGDYFTTRKIHDIWFDELKVTYYHRSLTAIMQDILKSDFIISDFIEPQPIKSLAKIWPYFYRVRSRIPIFIIFELRKK